MILRIASRNLFRQKRRSLLTALTMMGGFSLLSLTLGLTEGSYSHIIDAFTQTQIGHVQIHRAGYLDKPSLHKNFTDFEAVVRELAKQKEFVAASPRLYATGLSFSGTRTTGVQIVGMDPKLEGDTTRLRARIKQGDYLPDDRATREALVDESVARTLRLKPGSELILISQGADGSVANDIFTVSGVIAGTESGFGSRNVYLGVESAQELLALHGSFHEVAVRLQDASQAMRFANRLRPEMSNLDLDIAPWQVVAADFYRAMQVDKKGNLVSLGIITLIVALGVLNTVLMTLLERTREFGVMKAIGSRPGVILRIVVTENLLLSLVSCGMGLVPALLGHWYLIRVGIALPEPTSFAGIQFSRMYSEISAMSLLVPAAVTVGTALIVSLIPAIRVGRMPAIKALHSA